MTSSSAHTQSRVLIRDSVPALPQSDGGLNDTCTSDFTAFYPQSVRQEDMENTSDILQGSVVAAEAEALLSEFRQSFLSPEPSTESYADSLTGRSRRDGTFSIGTGRRADSGGGKGTDRGLKISDPASLNSLQEMDRIQEGEREGEGEGGSSSSRSGSSYSGMRLMSPKKDSLEDMEMFAFLEKYSDRLVDMVSDKVMAKSIAKERSSKTS